MSDTSRDQNPANDPATAAPAEPTESGAATGSGAPTGSTAPTAPIESGSPTAPTESDTTATFRETTSSDTTAPFRETTLSDATDAYRETRPSGATAAAPARSSRPLFGTIFWGIVLLTFAAFMVITTLFPVNLDPTLWLVGSVIVIGLLLVVAGIAAASRRAG